MPNRLSAPKAKDPIAYSLHLKPFRKFTLDNGINVFAVDAGAEDVLQLEFIFNAGNWYESQNLVAATTNYLLKNGTSEKNAFEINEHFEYYGAYLNRSCYNETATLSLHGLTKHLPELLPVIQELIMDSVLPESELDLYRQNMKQKLLVNLKKCDFVANRLIDEYLYGIHHPYGKYSSTIAYDAIQADSLREFYTQYYKHGQCSIFVGGRLPENIEPLLNQYFGNLPLNQKPIPDIKHPVEAAGEKKYRIINDPDGIQGAIRLARPYPGIHHPDFSKVQVVNTILGGYFGSRLMRNIREDKGYTYGIYSYIQNHMHETAWMISTEAGKDVCEASIAEAYNEMQEMRDNPVSEEELLLVKNYLIGTILGDLDGPFHILGRWKNIILNNLGEDHFQESISQIKEITPKEVQELANKYLHPEEFYELVVV
ncbi:MAG: insulinase family protein [Chitinophagaceae bacterium]|nr:insulinase family protein [Chitinophagaceae bacterium]